MRQLINFKLHLLMLEKQFGRRLGEVEGADD